MQTNMPIRYELFKLPGDFKVDLPLEGDAVATLTSEPASVHPAGEVIRFVRGTVFSAPAEVADEETPFKSDRSAPGSGT
jgi:hypothetical protein